MISSLNEEEVECGAAHIMDPLNGDGGRPDLNGPCGKDGFTVKKLIALMLVVAFLCVGTVGCSSSSSSGTSKPTTPAPAK
jgi:hypothetical protein